MFTDRIQIRSQAIDMLKQQALARYGQKVDAIEEVKVLENLPGSHAGINNVTHVKGVAIAFLPEQRVYSRPRPKPKPAKAVVRKSKTVITKKPEVQPEVVITPSEILK